MKTNFLSFILFSFFISLFCISCDKENNDDDNTNNNPPATGSLKVRVKKNDQNTIYTNGGTINLYKSELDKTNGIIYRNSISDSMGNCLFTVLPSQVYYISGLGVISGDTFLGDTFATVSLGKETTANLILKGEIKDNGNLNAFAILGQYPIGTYIGGAIVKLYLSESDLVKDDYYLLSTTSNVKPTEIGAIFYSLDPQMYYLKAQFEYNDGSGMVTYSGITDAFAFKQTETQVYINCSK